MLTQLAFHLQCPIVSGMLELIVVEKWYSKQTPKTNSNSFSGRAVDDSAWRGPVSQRKF